MKWLLANFVFALLLLGAQVWLWQRVEHVAACAGRAVTLVDGWQHGIPAKTLDALVREYDERC